MRSAVKLPEGPISYIHEGAGPAVLLLHTIGGSASEYARIMPLLARSLSVYAVDLPGHGASYPLTEHGDVPDIASALVQLMDALGLERTSVVGNSMSGTNALELAIRYPERVDRVVLISGVGPWSDQPGLPERGARSDPSENKEIEWLRRQFLDPSKADEPGFFEWWVSTRSAMDDEMIRAWRRRPLLDRSLSECRAPTLLVTGTDDPLHPDAWARAWAELLPNGEVAQIGPARHFLNLEQPVLLAETIARFLAR